ncbi:MAG: RagB/SusD family nutrient uptake outer membrane protein [Gemmatimonadetes bacterium]|nr:RagB/SusD family nutrient uptake outer membrane protein [Gemmatimonadota bacterium]
MTMRNSVSRRAGRALLLTALVSAGACDLDLTNPNSPPEELVLTTPDGIIALAVGMQGQFAGTSVGTGMVLNSVRAPALVTDELSTTSRALAADRSLVTGAGIDASFGVVGAPYSTAFRVVRSAEELLANAGNVGLSRGTRAGVLALARTYKAMALGTAILQYEQIPVTATLDQNPLQPRAVVLDTVLSLLEQARAGLGSVAAGELGDFNARVAIGYNLGDVINAMLARYYLIDGQYQQAIDAAARVPLNRLNVFSYPDPLRNPIWGYSQFNLDYVRGTQEFVAEADTSDDRPGFWLRLDQGTVNGSPAVPLRNLRQYADRNAPFPIYLPDEMRLIQAEAFARTGRLTQAATLVNGVRTQCTPSATTGNFSEPVACMPALGAAQLDTEAKLLAEIAYQRRYELYLQGLRWEDIRRFGTAVSRETPTIQWLPLPQNECVLNPAAPC